MLTLESASSSFRSFHVMEAERSSRGGLEGSGSWHPALRPDSYAIASGGDAQDIPGQEHGERDVIIEPQPSASPKKSMRISEKPLDFAEGHQERIDEPRPFTSHLDPYVAVETRESGQQPRSEELDVETITLNGVTSQTTSPASLNIHPAEAQITDQSQGVDSLPNDSIFQKSHHVHNHETEPTRTIDEFGPGTQVCHDLSPKQMIVSGPVEEMDKAFRSELEHEALGHASIDRTNSFPEVPTLHKPTDLTAPVLSKSQAEDFAKEEEAIDQYQTIFTRETAQNGTLVTNDNDDDQDFFANLDSVPAERLTPSATDEEVRYEEGLPLVPSERVQEGQLHMGMQADTRLPEKSQVDPADDNAGFFDTGASVAENRSIRPQELDRKTTTQVLDAMHYEAHHIDQLAPETQQVENPRNIYEERPSFADSTGEGSSMSAHTVKSQVLSEEHTQSVSSKPKEDDLAEMWKAALGDDELLDENEASLDPSALFQDDDGFLDDLAGQAKGRFEASHASPLEAVYNSDGKTQELEKSEQRPKSRSNKYIPDGVTAQPQQSTSYSNQQGQFSNVPNPQVPQVSNAMRSSVSTPAGFGGAGATAQQPYSTLAPQRPQMQASAQSFADKSKGGYTSPYDLPMDITRPRKRNNILQNAPLNQTPPDSNIRPPPPRSSSMFTGPSPHSHPLSSQPTPKHIGAATAASSATPSTLKASPSTGSFFEELAPKPRPSTGTGKYTPPLAQNQAPQPPPTAPSMDTQASADHYPRQANTQAPQTYQLRQPEKLSLYGNMHPSQPPSHAVPAINSRYSPAPPQSSTAPPSRNRYASSPMGGSQPPVQALPFQPRTSSPLAQSSVPRQSADAVESLPARPSSEEPRPNGFPRQGVFQHPMLNHHQQQSAVPSAEQPGAASPPPVNSRYVPLSDSPSSGSQATNTPSTDRLSTDGAPSQQSHYEPSSIHTFGGPPRMPPQRSQTQSPGAAKVMQEIPPNQIPLQRPASVSERKAPSSAYAPSAALPQQSKRPRGYSEAINYIRPTDGRELDPLERWKGCPIVAFGFGGNVATSYPVYIPRYAPGQKAPMVKCGPGEVKVRSSKLFTLEEDLATFPGPLRTKGKKKEVLEWLQSRIDNLESNALPTANAEMLPDPTKCYEEKVLLWKIVKVLVEHDGTADGNQAAEQAVRVILSPELNQGDAAVLPVAGVSLASSGITRRDGSTGIPEAVNQNAMEELRKTLLHGNREKAVWFAVDNRMWAHAMLVASTLDPNISKQVSSEFVKQEVKSFGENTESLSALYQVFSGNGEESMDELVPPSARAGLQMVSKAAPSGPTRNALEGLDRWRETLTLILSNRTPDDGIALVSLGQLLAGYGRTEAAHICYIFAKSPGLFGGPDDAQVCVALLGADHLRQPFDYGRDMDSILLTEVYDFARTILASSSTATISPHLQAYKLYHAMVLAEYNHKTEALQYCDAITSALKSTTRLSPYYHPLLFGALENLTERLRQAPKDGSGSWISRPSIDKVSGSIWAKFNSYVAGDESDAASSGSGMPNEAEAGPFARVAGDSPNISRSPSVGDLYGSQPLGLGLAPAPTPMTQPVNSRYAPVGLHTSRSPQEQARHPLQEPQRQDSLRPHPTTQQHSSRPISSDGSMPDHHKPQYRPTSYAPQQDSYLPTPPTQPQYLPEATPEHWQYRQESYRPSQLLDQPPPVDQHQPSFGGLPVSSYGYSVGKEPSLSEQQLPPSPGYTEPSTGGYEPPSYNPPSYNPDIPQADSPIEEKPKKRDIMDDDDDDFETRAATMRKEERARKDREADELMRKAAEEDGRGSLLHFNPSQHVNIATAKKDSHPKLNSKKSGWFGGWLGGGSKENKDSGQQQGNAPIKVKLGEESSFYFDKEKGKWVNKKAGPEDEKASAPPPPPPKGPPSRAVSSVGGPPTSAMATPPMPPMPTGMPTPPVNLARPPMQSNPASVYSSRSGTPAVGEGGEATATPTLGLGPPSGPPSAPPSRPTTSQNGAGGLDDLIGAPQQRKGGTVRAKAKKKGYVDVMAK